MNQFSKDHVFGTDTPFTLSNMRESWRLHIQVPNTRGTPTYGGLQHVDRTAERFEEDQTPTRSSARHLHEETRSQFYTLMLT